VDPRRSARGEIGGAAGWLAVGALGVLGLASVASIGAPLIVAGGLLAVALAAGRVGGAWWALAGAAAAFLVLGLAALPWQSCPTGTTTVVDPPRPGQSNTSSCGGVHPAVWFALGAASAAAGLSRARGTARRAAGA
jgi:hypothetical protein